MSSSKREMSFEQQSEARYWIDLGDLNDSSYPSPLKLTASEVGRLYRILGVVLRRHVEHASDVGLALTDEADDLGRVGEGS
jgi:hypothetical protein